MVAFSERLKNLRIQQNLTMQTLADEAKVSKSMISKIERDEVQPTLDMAARLARALGTTLSEMLHAKQEARVVFLPKGEQAIWEDSQHIVRRNISPIFAGLKIEWLHMQFPGKTAVHVLPDAMHGMEKYILMIKGTLEVKINNTVYKLQKDDSLFFDARYGHDLVNPAKETAEYYIIVRHE